MSPKKRSPNDLTSTQLGLLSAAAQREDGAIELAPNLKGGAADKVVSKLLRDGLIEEIPARGALPIWRRDEEKEAVALRITTRGLAAIGIDEHRTSHGGAASRERIAPGLKPGTVFLREYQGESTPSLSFQTA